MTSGRTLAAEEIVASRHRRRPRLSAGALERALLRERRREEVLDLPRAEHAGGCPRHLEVLAAEE
ncbi:MAG: hypothetical protein M5U28_50650 [Sandaracinaceae bacterium]|nr:hypothetical protein [Sandaracinaceae bacterium]